MKGAGSVRTMSAIVGVVLTTLGISLGATTLAASPGQPQASVEKAQAIREKAESAYRSFAGTAEQRNAGYILRAYAQNGAMDNCLAEAGFPEWDWSLSRQYYVAGDPLSAGTWLSEPNRGWRSEELIAQRLRLFAEDEMNKTQSTKEREALITDCLNATQKDWPSESEVEAVTRPPAATELINAWHSEVEGYVTERYDLTGYYACMDEAGLALLDDTGLRAEDLGRAIASLDPPNGAIPVSTDAASVDNPEWQRFLAAEKEVTDADWACREDVYNELILGVEPLIDDFMARNAEKVVRARTGWLTIEEDAKSLGYTGQVGPLGK